MKKKIIITIICIIVVLGTAGYFNRVKIKEFFLDFKKQNLPGSVSYEQAQNQLKIIDGNAETVEIIPIEADLTLKNSDNNIKTETTPIPSEFNLNIPFSSQAPNKIWDDVHKEACEETSALMAAYYIEGKTIASAAAADKEILALIEWEKNNFGFWKDSDAAKTADMIKKYYGLKNVTVKYDIKLEDIKKEIVAGHPVIVPLAGRLLGNPFYTPPGPFYHMLVVRGYTKDKIITNDPGTKNGENYVYTNNVFYNAIHDWNSGDVMKGKRAMIVVGG